METEARIDHIQILLTGTVALTVLVVFIILFVVQYQKRKIKEQEDRRKLIENNQEKILAAILQTQEGERKRIAHDLHDELGNALAIAKMNLGMLTRNFTGTENQETVLQTYSIIDETLKNVRRLSKDLHPVLLEKFGLAAAIEVLAKKCASAGLEINISIPHEISRLPAQVELNIFRMVQELLSNALKHSHATKVDVNLEIQPNQLLLSYQDNGKGFSYSGAGYISASETGIGMITIDTRVRMLKGTWNLETQPGKGTAATIIIPVPS